MMESDRLLLRPLTEGDVTERYVSWLNDPAVNRYLEIRFSKQTKESVGKFVASMEADSMVFLFGIFWKDKDLHIGNIKLGPICQRHKAAEIGLLIGDRAFWGKGIATEAIKAVVKFGFETMGIQKIEAGCYQSNAGSLKAFEKAGFKIEGVVRSRWVVDGKRQDGYRMGILPSEMKR
jgi:RimJ/RimL family protein N-acetyltransferase